MLTRVLVSSLMVAACGVGGVLGCGGAVGEAVRPDEQTATDALGVDLPECSQASYAEPLIVDWESNARVDLEVAMKDGLVVVKYDCKRVEILKGCHMEGDYEFAGVSRKEEVVQMTSGDDLAVNLPMSAAKLSAEVKSGRSIDVAMVMVGKRSSSVHQATPDELQGMCDGATHYVRAASLGAFALGTGSVGKVAAVAEVMGYGGGAKSSSERKSMNKDGNLDDCRKADPSDADPPGQCQSAIRLELVPLTQEKKVVKSDKDKGKGKDKDVEVKKNPCPDGYKWSEGICVTDANAGPYLCQPTDSTECQTQCDKGHGGSCMSYAALLKKSGNMTDFKGALKKACDLDVAQGCGTLGWYLVPAELSDQPDNKQMQADMKTGMELMTKACNMGHGEACDDLATVHEGDWGIPKDLGRAAALRNRSCKLGYATGCFLMAYMHFRGEGVPKNPENGIQALKRACDGGSSDECGEMGEILVFGKEGVPKDFDRGIKPLIRACEADDSWCEDVGKGYAEKNDPANALKYYEKGCTKDGTWGACHKGGLLYKEQGKKADAERLWKFACENGDGDDASCKELGIPMKE